ncbi:MAG: class I SAM-dependent methyltransferase [Bacteroidales bacterium]|nr:class I SAM-dependent methyltransferase [Bacteroidales bacterium]
MLRKIYYLLSPSMRRMARRVYYFPVDTLDWIRGRREAMIPPKGMIFIGSGDFKKQGMHLLDILKRCADLRPDNRVLDIGCGIGRLAVPLTGYLSEKGSYEGFDIVKEGIDWCNKYIHASFPNFSFRHIDLKNDLYNLETNAEAKNFVFPYDDKSFDRVVLTSVFTHMMPDDVDNYLHEIRRVLRDGGKCMATFFLLNERITEHMNSVACDFRFAYHYDGYSLMDDSVKEANVAYQESFLNSLLCKNGLKAELMVHGRWSGLYNDCLDFQDVLILSASVD